MHTCAELISEDKLKIKITNSRQNVKKTTISYIRIASVCQWKQTKRAEQRARTHTHIQAGSLDQWLSTSGLSATVVVCACVCVRVSGLTRRMYKSQRRCFRCGCGFQAAEAAAEAAPAATTTTQRTVALSGVCQVFFFDSYYFLFFVFMHYVRCTCEYVCVCVCVHAYSCNKNNNNSTSRWQWFPF